MMLVHMEVHLKGYFLMRIQFEFEAWCLALSLRSNHITYNQYQLALSSLSIRGYCLELFKVSTV